MFAPAMTALELKTESRDGGVVIALTGELDIFTAGRLEEEVKQLEAAGTETVVLDLRELTFMDSTGLATILAADTRARGLGRRLAIVRAEASVQWRFESTGVESRLDFVNGPDVVLGAR